MEWKASGTGKCPVCGKGFVKQARNQRYCGPKCKQEARKKREGRA